MTRPADLTRQALITAALAVFAEKGFTAGSVRDITRRAKANGAAVNYHFGGKEGLYREVLRNALAAFENNVRVDDAEAAAGPKPRTAAPARPDAPKARRVLVTAADVLPPPRPASLAITAESASSEPTESPRLFGLKLPGSLAHVGGSVATTVASLGERIWDQLP